jgi:DNA-directed RNA polymerase specialized sigma24 family protein
MAYSYAREKRKFDAEWKRKALWYRKEGMSEENIEAMHRFDLEQFNRDRAYESRRRPLETACGSCYVQAPEAPDERYSWIDEVSDQQLAERLHALPEADLELLTLIAIDGKTYRDVAEVFSCSHQNISRHIARIRKILS